MWQGLMSHLTWADAIALEMPGTGRSDALPAPTLEGLADAMAEALIRIGPPPATLVGFHSGAAVAAALAGRHERLVRRLAVVGFPLFDRVERQSLRVEPFRTDPAGEALAELWRSYAAYPAEVALREVADFLARPESAAVANAVLGADLEQVLAAVSCPVLVLHGSEDFTASFQPRVLEALTGAPQRAHQVLAGPTLICDTAASEVAAVLAEFCGVATDPG